MRQNNRFDIESLMKELLDSPKEKTKGTTSASSETTANNEVQTEEIKQPASGASKRKPPVKKRPSLLAADARFPVPVSQPADPHSRVTHPKKAGNVFIVKKEKTSGKHEIVEEPGIQRKCITPNMDTPLSELGMQKDILTTLTHVGIHDVGDLCMIRKNGLERYHILSDTDLSALCKFMGSLHISLW